MRLTAELEKTLRRYVQGDLEEGLRLELEELLITDPDAFDALGVVEDELIEEYLEEAGSDLERRRFEQHFLTSPERQRRLRFNRALMRLASRPSRQPRVDAPPVQPERARPVGGPAAWAETRVDWLRGARRPPAWVAVAAALALSLAGNVWLASRRPPAPGRSGATVPTFALSSGLLRAEGSLPRVAVPPDAAAVRLVLEMPGDDYPLYRAAILDEEGDEVWVASKLRVESAGGRAVIALVVPGAVLPRGDYRVSLSGITPAGEREALASSPFRVTAP